LFLQSLTWSLCHPPLIKREINAPLHDFLPYFYVLFYKELSYFSSWVNTLSRAKNNKKKHSENGNIKGFSRHGNRIYFYDKLIGLVSDVKEIEVNYSVPKKKVVGEEFVDFKKINTIVYKLGGYTLSQIPIDSDLNIVTYIPPEARYGKEQIEIRIEDSNTTDTSQVSSSDPIVTSPLFDSSNLRPNLSLYPAILTREEWNKKIQEKRIEENIRKDIDFETNFNMIKIGNEFYERHMENALNYIEKEGRSSEFQDISKMNQLSMSRLVIAFWKGKYRYNLEKKRKEKIALAEKK